MPTWELGPHCARCCTNSVTRPSIHTILPARAEMGQHPAWLGSFCLPPNGVIPAAQPVSQGSTPAAAAAPWHTQAGSGQPTFLLSLWSNLPRTFPPRSQNKANGLFIIPWGQAGPCAGREGPMSPHSVAPKTQRARAGPEGGLELCPVWPPTVASCLRSADLPPYAGWAGRGRAAESPSLGAGPLSCHPRAEPSCLWACSPA